MDPQDRPQPPTADERDEAGIHKEREAVSEGEANVSTVGEPLAEGDRQRPDKVAPASKPAPRK